MNYEQLQHNVIRGAALLDERQPGWAGRINLDRLEMRLCSRCILGQLLINGDTDFIAASHKLGIPHEESDQYGFDIPSIEEVDEIDPLWNALDSLWTDEVKRRVQ